MRAVLFCANPYAFGILEPLHHELKSRSADVIWFVPERLVTGFPLRDFVSYTSSIQVIYDFKSDAIFVPGNEVPHYLRGVKVQVFHGLAGEKRGHFRVRNYFDLYLTQGPYFTVGFQTITRNRTDIEVKETGWCKLDYLFKNHPEYLADKKALLDKHNRQQVVLYAPTFSPRLTSTITAFKEVFALADSPEVLLLIKFHDLMDVEVAARYAEEAKRRDNVIIIQDRNIIKTMIMSDLMISDTSSVVYEFLLLNKPVVTIRSTSANIEWCDIQDIDLLKFTILRQLANDTFQDVRKKTIALYHPYTDGLSSKRMIDAVEDYIARHGVPERRSINIYRRWKIRKLFGPEPK
jgi:CDP-ribitol ribitolphosphotransferase / teichoic acid ribitol-phosphate polymerase